MKKVLVLSAILAALAVAGTQVQAQGNAQPVIGMVDVQRAFDEYKNTKASNEEINRLAATFMRELEVREKHRHLSEADMAELVRLATLANPSTEDRNKLQQLENRSKQLDEEFNALVQKADLSEAERQRQVELRNNRSRNEQNYRNLQEDYLEQLEKRKNELSSKITEDIRQAIEKVAQQQGLATVVDKIAILYGGKDVTDEVIKVLNGS